MDSNLDLSMFSNQWFITLFSYQFSTKILMKIWSILFLKGEKILIRVALAIIKYFQQELDACQDGFAVLDFLKNISLKLTPQILNQTIFFGYIELHKQVNNRLINRLSNLIDMGRELDFTLKRGSDGRLDWSIKISSKFYLKMKKPQPKNGNRININNPIQSPN